MKTFFLQKGLVVKYRGELLEMVGRTGQDLYFEVPETARRETFEETKFWRELHTGSLQVVQAFASPMQLIHQENESDKAQDPPNLLTLSVHQQEEVNRRHQYVSRLMNAGLKVGQIKKISQALVSIAQELGDERPPSAITVYRWWKTLTQAEGDTSSLISKAAYRRARAESAEREEALLQQAIDYFYLRSTRPSTQTAYKDYLALVKQTNAERSTSGLLPLATVCHKTFYNRIQDRPKYDVLVARFGHETARHQLRMIRGHLPADYPLDAVEIDHTPLNLYVIDDELYLPLGRPWLTALKDRYSGILLGFYLSFEQTGLSSIFGAIKHSLHTHQSAHQLWDDLVNPWPSFGRARMYVSDRGLDFVSLRYRSAITGLGAMYELCQVRTPWLKGSVERFFRTLEQTFFETTPGRTFAKLEMRHGYNPAEQAVIRFSTLVYLMHKWAVDFHNVQPHSRRGDTALERWQEGVGVAPPPYPVSVDDLNIILGHRERGVLSHEGLRYKGLSYADESLARLLREIGGGNECEFVVSPENLGFVQVMDPRTKQFFKVHCTRPEYAEGITLFQHNYLKKEAATRSLTRSIDGLLQARALMQDVIQEEVQQKSSRTKARLARCVGINSNSALKGEAQTLASPFGNANAKDAEVKVSTPSFTSVRRLGWGA